MTASLRSLFFLLLWVACLMAGGEPAAYSAPPVAVARAARDAAGCGTVVIPAGLGLSDPQDVTSLNPLLTNSVYNQQVIGQILRPLAFIDRTVHYAPALSLASAITTPDDGQTWHITLKPWRWSDGTPVTSADVVFTFDLIRKLGPAYINYRIGGIPDLLSSVRALSAHEVEIRLTQKTNPAWFLRLGLGQKFILPEHVFQGLDLRALRARQLDLSLFKVSDGAFRIDELQVGRYMSLVPNPLYGGRHPLISRLVVDFLAGGNALQALRSGEIDAANIPFRLWDLARALPHMHVETLDGPFGYLSMIFNLRSPDAPFLNDVHVREAIARALDQREMSTLAFHGQARSIHGPIPVAMGDFLSPLAKAGYPSLGFDPAAARRLLDDAGWKPGPDGIRVKDGRRLSFSIVVSAGVVDRLIVLQVAQRNLAAVGIGLDIRGVEFNQLFATLGGNGHGWDSIMIGWTIESYPDNQEFFSSTGGQNYGHFQNADIDRLNDAVITTPGDSALFAVQDAVAKLQPWIFLPDPQISVLVRDGIGGVRQVISPVGTLSPELLTLSGPLACEQRTAKQGPEKESGHAHPLGG